MQLPKQILTHPAFAEIRRLANLTLLRIPKTNKGKPKSYQVMQVTELAQKFLFEGNAFKEYKETVRQFVQPPSPSRLLHAAINRNRIELVRDLLENDFESIARAEFAWLTELAEVGYDYQGIAELLIDEQANSPWIYFEPQDEVLAPMSTELHQITCAHQIDHRLDHSSPLKAGLSSRPDHLRTTGPSEHDLVKRRLNELCGLAGIIPSSRILSEWDGQAIFDIPSDLSGSR
ncbi:hypothetical protein LTR66_011454 [Elasticomyces elasticus]|nr:hypothetical protein LTR66_011454 [Elasticomyces elasticus]